MTGPLTGLRIANTRAASQAGPLSAALRAAGASPIDYPCIEIVPPTNIAPLVQSIAKLRLGAFDWLILTSVNTVEVLASCDLRLPIGDLKIAAVGDSTAEAFRGYFASEVDFQPSLPSAAGLAAELPIKPGQCLLLPGSSRANPDLARGLEDRGGVVTSVVAYQTVTGEGGADLPALLARHEVDALTFASPSAIDGLISRLGDSADFARNMPTVCIGQTTLDAARQRGFTNSIIAKSPSIPALIDALSSTRSPVH